MAGPEDRESRFGDDAEDIFAPRGTEAAEAAEAALEDANAEDEADLDELGEGS